MARSAEKAMAILSRWTTMMNNEDKPKHPARRPFLATECSDLREAEKWRHTIIRETAKKVSQIQNAGMGEFRLRDLNDEINKLIREKRHWEDRILELGGPHYAKVGPKMIDHEGKEIPGNRGYKYFGAAKDLPGVRELFEHEPPKRPRKTRGELQYNVDADYYGYRDEDDGLLVKLEADIEKRAVSEAVTEWQKNNENGQLDTGESIEDDIYTALTRTSQPDDTGEGTSSTSDAPMGEAPFVAHVPVPSQQDIEKMLVRRKKQELLERYASEVLRAQSQEAKALLGE